MSQRPSQRESAIGALFAVLGQLSLGTSGTTVKRNAALPERVSDHAMAILRDGTIRMRERGRRKVFTTSVANVFFSAVRSETLTDIRRRQRRAAVIAQAKNGGRRCS